MVNLAKSAGASAEIILTSWSSFMTRLILARGRSWCLKSAAVMAATSWVTRGQNPSAASCPSEAIAGWGLTTSTRVLAGEPDTAEGLDGMGWD